MKHPKLRRIFVLSLLAFVVFLYSMSLITFIFGEKENAIYVFAYSSFFTVIVYFILQIQKNIEKRAQDAIELDSQTPSQDDDND